MKKSLFTLVFTFFALLLSAQPSFRQGNETITAADFPKSTIDRTPKNPAFSFAIFSDLHVCDTIPQNSDDLRAAVREVNDDPNLAFVLICGDISHNGDTKSLQLAKSLLGELKVPYYAVPGNHDTRVSESACTEFSRLFGDDRFRLFFNGYLFLGLNSGQKMREDEAHFSPQDIEWLNFHLKKSGRKIPVFAIVHHPLLNGGVDNWWAATDLLREYNIQAIFSGHFHRNDVLNYDEIRGVVVRSTLREDAPSGGYTVCQMADSLYFSEKRIGEQARFWYAMPVEPRVYIKSNPTMFTRPNFSVNKAYKNTKIVYQKSLKNGVYSAPKLYENRLLVGDDSGLLTCFEANKGKTLWQFKTPNRIVATPAVARGKAIFGNGDGTLYALDISTGKLVWKFPLGSAICAEPLIDDDMAYFGCSNGHFYAVNIESGAVIWKTETPAAPIQLSPLMLGNTLIFSDLNKTIFAVDKQFGTAIWSKTLHADVLTSPLKIGENLACVTRNGGLVLLNANSGEVIWENSGEKFVASLGVSADGKTLFARNKFGKIFAFDITINQPKLRWKSDVAYLYDTNPTAVVSHRQTQIFATHNGELTAFNSDSGTIVWQQKFGNTAINSLVVDGDFAYFTTLDGILYKIQIKAK